MYEDEGDTDAPAIADCELPIFETHSTNATEKAPISEFLQTQRPIYTKH